MFDFCDIGEIIIAGEYEYGQVDVCRWLAIGDNIMWGIVLMPGREAAAGWRDEGVVVYNVTICGNEGFGKADDGFEVEQVEVGLAVLEHAMAQAVAGFAALWAELAIGVFISAGKMRERPVEVCFELCDVFFLQYIFEK